MIDFIEGADSTFFQPIISSDEEGNKWLKYYVDHWVEYEGLNRIGVTVLVENNPAGFVVLTERGEDVELDYYVVPRFRGQQVGRQILQNIPSWVKQILPRAFRLIAYVNPQNEASSKALNYANWLNHGLTGDRIVFTHLIPKDNWFRP